jgi:hypothetical protein
MELFLTMARCRSPFNVRVLRRGNRFFVAEKNIRVVYNPFPAFLSLMAALNAEILNTDLCLYYYFCIIYYLY